MSKRELFVGVDGVITGCAATVEIVKEKVEPTPTSLSTHISPPISSVSRCAIASPSPVPP